MTGISRATAAPRVLLWYDSESILAKSLAVQVTATFTS